MFVKTKNTKRFNQSVQMKNIKFEFDGNGVSEVSDEHKDVVLSLNVHPYDLKVLEGYDPVEEGRKTYKKKLNLLKKEEVASIAEQHGIKTKDEDGKELLKEVLVNSVVEKLL